MSTKTNQYRHSVAVSNTKKLRELLAQLPPFLADYFRGIDHRTKTTTQLGYAIDLRVFFRFMVQNNPEIRKRDIRDITLKDFSMIKPVDIEEYLEYLKSYDGDGNENSNSNQGRARKLSSLRSCYHYFNSRGLIQSNPAEIVEMPSIDNIDKSILRLDQEEMVELIRYMHNIEETLSEHKKAFFKKTKFRDIAIVTLLLGTGIRVSELVGLDINHVDLAHNKIVVTRKGGNEEHVYFGEEVAEALEDYLTLSRVNIIALSGHEKALFYSMQKKRISVDAVENLVVKYASEAIPTKHITPHRLRASYGTALYNETGDLYLCAEVLGHKSVETTRKHYADILDERKRKAGTKVKLR